MNGQPGINHSLAASILNRVLTWIRLGLVLSCLATLLGACDAGESSGEGMSDRSIVLDRAIGGVAIAEPRSAVEERLGDGVPITTSEPAPVSVKRVRYSDDLDVVYVASEEDAVDRAYLVETRSPRYRTAEGVGVGSSRAEVEAIPGVRCFDGGHECQHGYAKPPRFQGTTFFVDGQGIVQRVAITLGH